MLIKGTYCSAEGAQELDTLRVGNAQKATGGGAPIRLLFRGPSDECGCPEELWQIDGIQYLIHFEDHAASHSGAFCHVIIFTGDDEIEYFPQCRNLDYLRAWTFNKHAELMQPADTTKNDGAAVTGAGIMDGRLV